jgi:TP901 family phage tail tape measure protein
MANKFSVEAIFKGRDDVSKVVAGIEGRVGRATSSIGSSLKDLDKANGKIIGSFADLAKQAVVVGAVVGGALAAGLHHVIEVGAGFEQSITNVGAVMGKSRSQIQDLEKEAMRLGVVTQFSSSEVAEAMEFMAKKGFDSGEILAGIPGILNAVAASGQGMAEVATVVGSAIRGFGLEAADAGKVANILAFVAEKTGATITDLGTSLAIAAPTAKTLGVSIEDTATAVGLLQKVGLDASTAGSSVSTMLAKISKPSTEIAAKMTALGVKFKDAKGNMLPFRDVLGQFVKVGGKVGGNMDRMAFFAELVGLRGDKAALALADMAKAGDFDKLSNGVKNVGDYAEKVAKIRLDTTQGSWKLLTSTIEVIETKLFSLQSTALRGAIDRTNDWLQANQELIKIKAAEYIENLKLAIDAFASGAREGFNSARAGLDLFLGPLERLAGMMLGFQSWPFMVRNLGQAFGVFVAVAGTFMIFAGAVKVARVALMAYQAAVWVANGAVVAYNFVTDASAIATGLNTAATAAGRVATLASTVALGAKNAVTFIAFAATTRFTFAQVASKLATVAVTAATWLWNAAVGAWNAIGIIASNTATAYSIATASTTTATEAATAATDLANLSMGTFVLTIGAAVAAVVALYAAYDQFLKLKDVSGGWEGIKAGIGGVLAGEGYAKGVDDYQNHQARQEAADRGEYRTDYGVAPSPATPQVASPTENFYTAPAAQPQGFYGELTVRAEPGTSAKVSKQPSGGVGLRVPASGTP